jgi:hypothetical protein
VTAPLRHHTTAPCRCLVRQDGNRQIAIKGGVTPTEVVMDVAGYFV